MQLLMKIQLQQVLKREIKSRGASINSVAKACKVPLSVLHGWVNGVLPSAKNLHHVKSLSDYFGVPVSLLLFNTLEEKSNAVVLFNSEFSDGEIKYRLLVEKIKK